MKKEVLPGLIDPDRVPDVFAEGIASIEMIGASCLRWTLYVTRDMGDGDIDHVVVARVVAPGGDVLTWLRQTEAVLSGKPFLTASCETAAEMH